MNQPALKGADLAKAIDAQPYPKVTKEGIEARIASVAYHRLGETTVTVCAITMVNGYSVRGEAACVDPRNFNEDIGKGLAYADAFRKLWSLEGYLLAEKTYAKA